MNHERDHFKGLFLVVPYPVAQKIFKIKSTSLYGDNAIWRGLITVHETLVLHINFYGNCRFPSLVPRWAFKQTQHREKKSVHLIAFNSAALGGTEPQRMRASQ